MIDVTASEYMPYRVEQSNLLFVVYGRIEENGKTLSAMRVVTLLPPDLTIKVYSTSSITNYRGICVKHLIFYDS